MICLLTAVWFPPGGGRRYNVTQIGNKQLYTLAESIHKTIQKQRTHKRERKHTNQENKQKQINWKNIQQLIRK